MRASQMIVSVIAISSILLLVAPHESGGASPDEGSTRTVAIVHYDGVELLDFAGPGEVFAVAGELGAHRGIPAFEVHTVAMSTDPVISQGFLRVTPGHAFDSAPKPDIVVIPGGSSSRLSASPEFRTWLDRVARTSTILTVCTGAFPLAETDLLDGLEVTTWYGALDRLERAAPEAHVQPGRRFVDNGRIITTAGVSAGIDGSLHLVARLLGRAVADRTAEYMEYAWTPEAYLARSYPHLNPSLDETGRAIQEADLAFHRGEWKVAARLWEAVVADDPADSHAWDRLASCRLSLGQHGPAAAAFREAAANPARRPHALYNAACALALDDRQDEAMTALEEAVDAGFDALDHMRRDPDLVILHELSRFRAMLDHR